MDILSPIAESFQELHVEAVEVTALLKALDSLIASIEKRVLVQLGEKEKAAEDCDEEEAARS